MFLNIYKKKRLICIVCLGRSVLSFPADEPTVGGGGGSPGGHRAALQPARDPRHHQAAHGDRQRRRRGHATHTLALVITILNIIFSLPQSNAGCDLSKFATFSPVCNNV